MSGKSLRTFTRLTALASLALAATGCVANRPSRNAVPNENQYVRKDFLTQPAVAGSVDPGWFVKATIVQSSTPNPLGNGGIYQGAESTSLGVGGAFVHFAITQDKLQMINNLQIGADQGQGQTTSEVVNAWDGTSVDLQYEVDLDGEKSNLFYENTELDWQVRQWVKLNFAKNDFSDLAPFGGNVAYVLNKCVGNSGDSASTTLVTNSFLVDEANDYMEFTLNETMNLKPFSLGSTDADEKTCAQLFGQSGIDFTAIGRQSVSFNVKYSFVRPAKLEPSPSTYSPLALQEKDQIQHKYGVFQIDPIFRDYQTGLAGANQLAVRWDPNSQIVYYFTPGMPPQYQAFFQTSVANETNAVLKAAGASGSIKFLNWNDLNNYQDAKGPNRQLGDIRYSFINWHSDLDIGPDGLAGVAQFFQDPRTGQILTASVNAWAYAIQDRVVQRLAFYLTELGLDPTVTPKGSCTAGQQLPLVPATVQAQHDGTSTVFARMQTYLGKPVSQFGNLGPADFVIDQTQTVGFADAFYAIVPYNVYADPNANPFVTPTTGQSVYSPSAQWAALQQVAEYTALASQVDHGIPGYDDTDTANMYQNSLAFAAKWNQAGAAINQQANIAAFSHGSAQYDVMEQVSYLDVFKKAQLQCVNGAWQTYQQYTAGLVDSIYEETVLHEFGHTLGLRHNFMGSIDQRNYLMESSTQPGLYSSSVMDYNVSASAAYFQGKTTSPDGSTVFSSGGPGWGPYDIAALGFIYGNALTPTDLPNYTAFNLNSYSGQTVDSASGKSAPWKDPFGVTKTGTSFQENIFFYCSDEHIQHTPLCQQFDVGSTPSEIVANAIDNYEWQYHWTNFRQYRKYWDQANYASNVNGFFNNLLRWQTLWIIDWNLQSLIQNYAHLGIGPAPGSNYNYNDYLVQLSNGFESDISMANQMVAAFDNAVVNQASGERPWLTTYDPFFGDVTQQGILIDKLSAITSFNSYVVGSTYGDPTQGGNVEFTPLSLPGGTQDPQYGQVAELAAQNMAGAGYAIFADYLYTAVGLYANTTHQVGFNGRVEMRDWIGGLQFTQPEFFLDYLHDLAQTSQNASAWGCVTGNVCEWDPRQPQPGDNASCPWTRAGCPGYLNYSSNTHEFIGPDGRYYIWAWIQDRNQYILIDRDRNPIAYNVTKQYNVDVIQNQDDGATIGAAYPYEMAMKAVLDAFTAANASTASGGSTSSTSSSGN